MHLIANISKNVNAIKTALLTQKFTKIYLILDSDADSKNLPDDERLTILSVDKSMDSQTLSQALKSILEIQLREDKIIDFDIAVYLGDGSGKDNSAMLSALMKLGYGIRLVDFGKDMIEL